MGYVVGITKSVKGMQIGRVGKLPGKRATWAPLHEVEGLGRSRGASLIPELCVTKDGLTQIDIRFV
jgi:hypothetical protein